MKGVTLEEALAHPKLCEQRINAGVVVSVHQIIVDGQRSQFLALVINDELRGRWVCLRLSTARKVIKFLAKHDLLVARRLKWQEKLALDGDRRSRLSRAWKELTR